MPSLRLSTSCFSHLNQQQVESFCPVQFSTFTRKSSLWSAWIISFKMCRRLLFKCRFRCSLRAQLQCILPDCRSFNSNC